MDIEEVWSVLSSLEVANSRDAPPDDDDDAD